MLLPYLKKLVAKCMRASITVDTPYRHHEFYTPIIAPYDTAGGLLWPSVVATFLRPIIESTDMMYWFCNHGTDFQFCFAHSDYERIERRIEVQKQAFQIVSKVVPNESETVGQAFRGKRWISEAKLDDDSLAARRSWLVFSFLHATSALYLDGLVQEGLHWRLELNHDVQQNPEGSGFETLLHLLCNITEVPTMVQGFQIQNPIGPIHGIETPFAISHIAATSEFPVSVGGKIRVQY